METLENEFEKYKPWISQFYINGKTYGGKISFEYDPRVSQFNENFLDVRTILDLGSLEGGQTFALAKRTGVSITGLEGRDYNIKKEEFVKTKLGLENIKFICSDLETDPLTTYGKFDAIFCSGILYHLPKPWELINKLSRISPNIFIWTHYAADDKANETVEGYRGYWYNEHGLNDPLSGMSQKSFWVTLSSLQQILYDSGYESIKIIEDNNSNPHGSCVTLAASKEKR